LLFTASSSDIVINLYTIRSVNLNLTEALVKFKFEGGGQVLLTPPNHFFAHHACNHLIVLFSQTLLNQTLCEEERVCNVVFEPEALESVFYKPYRVFAGSQLGHIWDAAHEGHTQLLAVRDCLS